MTERITRSNLKVSKDLDELVKEILNGLEIEPEEFWVSLEEILNEFGPRNEALLNKRIDLQNKINDWHRENQSNYDFQEYKEFLEFKEFKANQQAEIIKLQKEKSQEEGFSNINDDFNDVLLFGLLGIFFLIFTDYVYKLGRKSY